MRNETGDVYVRTHTSFWPMVGHDAFIPSRMITLYRKSENRMELAVGVKRGDPQDGMGNVGPLLRH